MLVLIILLVASTVLPAQAPSQPDLWFRTVEPSVLKTRVYEDPSQRFSIEMPAKDWEALPGGVDTFVLFQQKKRMATVAIERQVLEEALEQRFVEDTFVGLRAAELKDADPKASPMKQRIIPSGPYRVAVILYERPGVSGKEEVRVYYMLRGRIIYRLICRTAAGQMGAFETVFAHMAASFKAPDVT